MSTNVARSPSKTSASRRSLPRRTLLLAAPACWYVFFWVTYLAAEAACDDGDAGPHLGGTSWLSIGVVTLGAVVSVAAVALVWRGRRRAADAAPDQREEADDLRLIGGLLGALFVAATVMVAIPALVLVPC